MQIPNIGRGTIEQAIYTWSSRNIDGARGEGFGAVSSGLSNYASWLQNLDPTNLRMASPHLNDVADAKWDFSQYKGYGRYFSGKYAIAYKKMLSGTDLLQRRRHVVHLLIGWADEVDYLWTVTAAMQYFLHPEQVKLDDLPVLSPLPATPSGDKVTSIEQWKALARVHAEEVVKSPLFRSSSQPLPLDALTGQVLSAAWLLHPRELWPTVCVNSWVGEQGPEVTVSSELPQVVVQPKSSLTDFERASEQLRREIAPSWKPSDGLAGYERPLEEWVHRSFSGDSIRRSEPSTGTWTPQPLMADVYADFMKQYDLPDGSPLNEVASVALLRYLTDKGIPPEEFISLPTEELELALIAVTAKRTADQWRDYLLVADWSRLTDAWRRTGLGLLLYVVAGQTDRSTSSLAPRRAMPQQIKVAIEWLLKDAQGSKSIAYLLGHGLAAHNVARRLISDLLANKPQLLFDQILPDANLQPALVLEVIRDNLDAWVRYRNMRDPEIAALTRVLARKRRVIFWRGAGGHAST